MKKKWTAVFSVLALSLALASCGGAKKATETKAGGAETTAAGTAATGEKTSNGTDTFTYIIDGDTGNTVNPLTADDRYGLMTMHALFAPLLIIFIMTGQWTTSLPRA